MHRFKGIDKQQIVLPPPTDIRQQQRNAEADNLKTLQDEYVTPSPPLSSL